MVQYQETLDEYHQHIFNSIKLEKNYKTNQNFRRKENIKDTQNRVLIYQEKVKIKQKLYDYKVK